MSFPIGSHTFKSCVFILYQGEAERAVEDPGSKRTSAGRPDTLNDPAPPQEKEKVKDAAKMFLNLKKQAGTTSRHRFAHFFVSRYFLLFYGQFTYMRRPKYINLILNPYW